MPQLINSTAEVVIFVNIWPLSESRRHHHPYRFGDTSVNNCLLFASLLLKAVLSIYRLSFLGDHLYNWPELPLEFSYLLILYQLWLSSPSPITCCYTCSVS
jgi:hypothetical protein